jgi:hypothetical protein
MPTYPPAVDGIAIMIQSSFKEPKALDASAQRFVKEFMSNLSSTDAGMAHEQEDAFQAHKAALLAEVREKETAVSQGVCC